MRSAMTFVSCDPLDTGPDTASTTVVPSAAPLPVEASDGTERTKKPLCWKRGEVVGAGEAGLLQAFAQLQGGGAGI